MTKYQALLLRFVKGAVASSIPILITELSGVTRFNSTGELKEFLIAVAVPLATGLLLALEKAITWQEPEKPVEIEEIKSTKAKKKSSPKSS